MLSRLKDLSGGVTIAGDGRHDSMGHSAKFGAYTLHLYYTHAIIRNLQYQYQQKLNLWPNTFLLQKCIEGHIELTPPLPCHWCFSNCQYYYLKICRHILAAVHFNFNLQREVKQRGKDRVERVKVSYPKFKNGEATVRDVRITPNFGKS